MWVGTLVIWKTCVYLSVEEKEEWNFHSFLFNKVLTMWVILFHRSLKYSLSHVTYGICCILLQTAMLVAGLRIKQFSAITKIFFPLVVHFQIDILSHLNSENVYIQKSHFWHPTKSRKRTGSFKVSSDRWVHSNDITLI